MVEPGQDDSGRFRLTTLGAKYNILKMLAETGTDFQGELASDRFHFRESEIAFAIGCRDATHWSHVKQGRQPTSAAQLRRLAIYFKLDVGSYLGPEAWEVFGDTTSVADFQAMLMRCGYGYYAARGDGDPIRALLDDLAPFAPSLQGIEIDVEVTPDLKGISDDEPEPDVSIVDLRERSQVRLRLDLKQSAHVVVLDCAHGVTSRSLEVAVLAPSARAKTMPLAAGGAIPTEATQRKPVFYIAPPPARHQLLAFVSETPIQTTWKQPEKGFAILTPGELGRFLAGIKELGPERVRVLTRPYRVVAG